MPAYSTAHQIAERFDRAADSYDKAARVQAQIAERLVQRAAQKLSQPPQTILDIGCGTGLVAEEVARHWPQAQITAIDQAPAMLAQVKRKLRHVQVLAQDIGAAQLTPEFDLILSSMALHWLLNPLAALLAWKNGLRPRGRMHVAVLVEGSFQEWRDLCEAEGLQDGLWPVPKENFTAGFASAAEQEIVRIDYQSARDFLDHLKIIGAATPRSDHRSFGIKAMRRLLDRAPQPFTVTYKVLYLELSSPISI
jgi:malonyl-CoA O-methyltransferase